MLSNYSYFTVEETEGQEAMTSLVMDNHKTYDLQENCKSPTTYPEVQMRQKNPADTSETQRKKRARNRLSNRRSTGFVFEDDINAALQMGPTGNNNGTTNH